MSSVAAPRRFKPAYEVICADFCRAPAFAGKGRVRGIKQTGLLFEAKVLKGLKKKECRNLLLASPWISFEDRYQGRRICQPDGLVFDIWAGKIIIVECKLRHTSDAWFQLHDLYRPVIENMFPNFEVCGVEICKYFEAQTVYPEKVKVFREVLKVSGFNGVMLWR